MDTSGSLLSVSDAPRRNTHDGGALGVGEVGGGHGASTPIRRWAQHGDNLMLGPVCGKETWVGRPRMSSKGSATYTLCNELMIAHFVMYVVSN